VLEQVSRKLEKFLDAFLTRLAGHVEPNPCICAICRNSRKPGQKIIVHWGEACSTRLPDERRRRAPP